MNLSQLTNDLKQDEGFSSFMYFDSVGLASIGYGRCIDKKVGCGISQQEAEYLLQNDIQAVVNQIDKNFPWFAKLSDNRQRAIANMVFQLGITRFLGFKNMIIALENYNFIDAASEIRNSRYYAQVPKRAERIASSIETG